MFPDEASCARYLEAARWPDGFACPTCGCKGEPYRVPARKDGTTVASTVLRCKACKKNVSLTAGTVMQGTHTPLSTWFWGAYLMLSYTPGISAVQFQRQLKLTRIETAFQILHKLRSGMVNPERDTIGGEYPVEVDECYVGGETRGEGRGVHHKTTVIGAVEVRTRADAAERVEKWAATKGGPIPAKKLMYAGRLRLRVISGAPPSQVEIFAKKQQRQSGRESGTLTRFVNENVKAGTEVRTDGYRGYDKIRTLGYAHNPMTLNGDAEKAEAHLPMIHLVFSNLQTWINGTHHGVSQQHLQAYLNEYVFRFNRRFYPMVSFRSVLGIGSHLVSPTYAQLYSGEWGHPS